MSSGEQPITTTGRPQRQTGIAARDQLLAWRLQQSSLFRAYDGFLEPSGSKARKATKAARAGIAKGSRAGATAARKQKPLPKNAAHDADANGVAKRKTAGALRKQLSGQPSADESPGPAPPAAAVKRQGRRPRPAGKHDKANRIAHKKLKLAYLARVQRTLETANKETPCDEADKKEPISFTMSPTEEAVASSAQLPPLATPKLSIPPEASVLHLKRFLAGKLQLPGPDSQKLKPKDVQILCRGLVMSNDKTLLSIKQCIWPKEQKYPKELRYRLVPSDEHDGAEVERYAGAISTSAHSAIRMQADKDRGRLAQLSVSTAENAEVVKGLAKAAIEVKNARVVKDLANAALDRSQQHQHQRVGAGVTTEGAGNSFAHAKEMQGLQSPHCSQELDRAGAWGQTTLSLRAELNSGMSAGAQAQAQGSGGGILPSSQWWDAAATPATTHMGQFAWPGASVAGRGAVVGASAGDSSGSRGRARGRGGQKGRRGRGIVQRGGKLARAGYSNGMFTPMQAPMPYMGSSFPNHLAADAQRNAMGMGTWGAVQGTGANAAMQQPLSLSATLPHSRVPESSSGAVPLSLPTQAANTPLVASTPVSTGTATSSAPSGVTAQAALPAAADSSKPAVAAVASGAGSGGAKGGEEAGACAVLSASATGASGSVGSEGVADRGAVDGASVGECAGGAAHEQAGNETASAHGQPEQGSAAHGGMSNVGSSGRPAVTGVGGGKSRPMQELEQRLLQFVKSHSKQPTSAQVCRQADDIAHELGITKFKSTTNWYTSFCNRCLGDSHRDLSVASNVSHTGAMDQSEANGRASQNDNDQLRQTPHGGSHGEGGDGSGVSSNSSEKMSSEAEGAGRAAGGEQKAEQEPVRENADVQTEPVGVVGGSGLQSHSEHTAGGMSNGKSPAAVHDDTQAGIPCDSTGQTGGGTRTGATEHAVAGENVNMVPANPEIADTQSCGASEHQHVSSAH